MEGHIWDQFNTQLRVHCKPMKGHFCDQSNTKIRLYCIPMKGHTCDQCNTKVWLYCQPMKLHTCKQCKTESTTQPIIGFLHQNLHGYINSTGIVVNSATLRASYKNKESGRIHAYFYLIPTKIALKTPLKH